MIDKLITTALLLICAYSLFILVGASVKARQGIEKYFQGQVISEKVN